MLTVLMNASPASAQGTWSHTNVPAPDYNGGVMMLLTDGTVMVKTWYGGYGMTPGSTWDRLTPDSAGSYRNGSWSTTAPMNNDRMYFSSWLLNDGRLYVGGGEYGAGSAAEIYSPYNNSWTPLSTPGVSFGDGGSENLPDGRLLLAVNTGTATSGYIFDPASGSFTAAPATIASHDEVSWLKLPDNSILQVNFNSTATERYIPSLNTWITDDSVPVNLYDTYANEVGGTVLLPDGRGFFVGATGHTAFYTPSGSTSPGTWVAGPDLPDSQSTPDAPMAMMANGKILLATSPKPGPADYYPPVTSFYEFDYLTNAFTRIQTPTGSTTWPVSPYNLNMLALPDGSIMLCNQGDYHYYIYTPGAGALAAGAPTADTILRINCDTFIVTGTKFTGISEGANYGDDWSMASNYPLIRLVNGAVVTYARTTSWNRYGTQMTGSLADTAKFVLPPGLAPGNYTAQVIVNGNPSNTRSLIKTSGISPASVAVCAGSSVAMTAGGGGATWTSSSSATASVGSTTGVVTGLSSGVAVITALVGGCTSTASVSVNPMPAAITGAGHICAGAAATLTSATTGGSWSVSNPSLGTIDAAAGTLTGLAAGVNVISYTVSGCSAVANETINPLPAAIAGTAAICAGTTTTLTCTPAGGAWSSSATATATVGAATGVVTGVSAGNPNITYTLATGCFQLQAMTVNPLPSAISGSATVCTGLTDNLTATPAGGAWSSTNALVASVGTTGIVTGAAQGTATISYLLPTGCKTTKNITVNPTPSAITGTGTVCPGSTLALSDASSGGTWTSGTVAKATIGSASGIVTGVAAGTSIISYTLAGSCRATKTITVNPLPAAISGTASVCAGAGTSLTDGTSGGSWTSGATGIATVGTAGLVTGVAQGTANISYTLATGCYAAKTVTVNPIPLPASGTGSVCQAATVTWTDAAAGGTWTSGSPAVANIGSATGVITGVNTGISVITYTTPACGYTTRVLTVNTAPLPITGSMALCAGSSVTLADAAGSGTWSTSDPSVAASGTIAGQVTGVAAGVTTVSYTTAACGSATAQITVNPVPSAIAGACTICAGTTTSLSETAAGGTWTCSDTTVASIHPASGSLSGIAAGLATVTYSTAGCGSVTRPVTISPAPGAISGPGSVCSGSSITLTDAASGSWSSANPAIASVGSATGVVTGLSAGTVQITLTTVGCGFVTAPVTVLAAPAPITGCSTICAGNTIPLADSTDGGYWTSSNSSIATVDSLTGYMTGVSGGTAAITYHGLSCGNATVSASVNALPAPISGLLSLCSGAASALSDVFPGGTWSSSNGGIAVVGSASGLVSVIAPGTATITYTSGSGCAVQAVLTVQPSPASLSIPAVCTGTSATIAATGGGTWSSANPLIAVIGSATGHLTGIAAGTTAITYTLPSGCQSAAPVTVNAFPSPISGFTTFFLGGTTTFSDAVPGGYWSSSNAMVATVDSALGTVTGSGFGIATISYTLHPGCSVTSDVFVASVPAPIAGVTTVCQGGAVTLYDPAGGGVWSSSNPAVATVGSSSGTVTGISVGVVNITYNVSGSVSVTTMTVMPVPGPVSGASVSCAGSAVLFSDSVSGGAWSSSNPAVATVDSLGIVHALSAGTVNISYAMGCGAAATHSLTVNPLPLAGTISGPDGLCIGATVMLTDSAGGGTWTSSGPAATIDGAGLMTGIASGSVVIAYTVTNIFSCTAMATRLMRVDGYTGNIYTQAGTGVNSYTGDGGPAWLATMQGPRDIVTDRWGNIYYCDVTANVIRKISASGIITTVVGNGSTGNGGDGGPATAASLSNANGLFVDYAGNMFIANTNSHTIRKVNAVTGIISTIAGTPSTYGAAGDGGPASAARLNAPLGICGDTLGNLYICDQLNYKVRKIEGTTGFITTIAGIGSNAYSGDGGPGTAARMSLPRSVVIDNSGNLYIADGPNCVIRKIVLSTGVITAIAGTGGVAGNTGDGGPATAAKLNSPAHLSFDGGKMLYIADMGNNRVRVVNLTTGMIAAAGGCGASGFGGDNGPAPAAHICQPYGVAAYRSGKVFMTDAGNRRIRIMEARGNVAISITGSPYISPGTAVTFNAAASIATGTLFQWKKNGVNTGTGDVTYTDPSPANGDVYQCIMTVMPGCGEAYLDTSNAITVYVAATRPEWTDETNMVNGSDFRVYPNPFSGDCHVAASHLHDGQAVIEILDQMGRLINRQVVTVENGTLTALLNLKEQPAGCYIVDIRDEAGVTGKLKCIKTGF